MQHFTCAVIGDWHLAFTTLTGLASLDHKCIFINPDETSNWSSFPKLDLAEPHINEKLKQFQEQGLVSFSSITAKDWSADYIWLAIDTPVDDQDQVDLTPLLKVMNRNYSIQLNKGFIVTSQVPLGFCSEFSEIFKIAYIPENLRLGQSLDTFLSPDRIVIGSDDTKFRNEIHELLNKIDAEFLLTDLATSEMIKHATNAFLACSISLSNQLAMIGEQYNVNNHTVGKALKMDSRIGKKAYVVPGKGFAGGTLPRDLRLLQSLGSNKNISTPLIDSIIEINSSPFSSVLRTLESHFKTLAGLNAVICGYSYKSDIDTLRRSPAIELASQLNASGIKCYGFDPTMNNKNLSKLDGIVSHLNQLEKIDFIPHIFVIITPRKSFMKIDWNLLKSLPQDKSLPPLFFDTEGIIPTEKITSNGYAYKQLWQPVVQAEEL